MNATGSPARRLDQQVAVGVALALAQLTGGDRQAVDGDLLAVAQLGVRVVGRGRPLSPVHRTPLGSLGVSDLADHPGYPAGRMDRDLTVADQLQRPVEVVRMGVGDEHAEQRLVQRGQAGPEGGDVGDQQVGVDDHHAGRCLQEVGVDEQAALGGGVGVDGQVNHWLSCCRCKAVPASDGPRGPPSTATTCWYNCWLWMCTCAISATSSPSPRS